MKRTIFFIQNAIIIRKHYIYHLQLLFIAFANDICNASELLFYILYADDTAVLLKGKELRELLVILNEKLERINLWLKANNLTLNTQKSVYMVFHRARLKSFNPPILINGTQLQEVSSTKYLGLIIDNKLKMDRSHCTYKEENP